MDYPFFYPVYSPPSTYTDYCGLWNEEGFIVFSTYTYETVARCTTAEAAEAALRFLRMP